MTTGEIALITSSAIQALATVVLVCVTIYYAIQTKKTVEAMDRSSKADFLPILMIGLYPTRSSDNTLELSIENVGRGLAKRPVKLMFPGVGPVYVNSISPKSPHSPNEEERVTIHYDIGYVLSLPEAERKIVLEYQDIFGRTIKTEAPLKEVATLGPQGNARGLAWDVWHPVIP